MSRDMMGRGHYDGAMMCDKKFDPKKLQKLNNPARLLDIRPECIRGKLDIKAPAVLIEIGAGTAFFSIAFLQQFQPSTLYACDLSETMINWMRENVCPQHPNIIPVKNEEHSVPLGSRIADLVFMIALHHELEYPSLMLDEAYRLLKPGGEIFVVDWKKQDMPDGPPTKIRCTPEQVKAQLTGSGFCGAEDFDDMPRHFLVVGKKKHRCP